MIVAAFYTLFNLRKSLVAGIKKAIQDIGTSKDDQTTDRTNIDLDFKKVFVQRSVSWRWLRSFSTTISHKTWVGR